MGKFYRVTEFAERIGRSASTVRRWEREGRITPKRTQTNQRYFDESDVRLALSPGFVADDRRVVVYCRVSSAGQKDDLESQIAAMELFVGGRGLAVDNWITEIGGGMNFRRKKFLVLVDDIAQGRISTLVVAHKDRLARFGFDLLDHLAKTNGCEILVANQETLSPEAEMVEDLLSIVHTFSCRLYGLRRYKKQLVDALTKQEGVE